MTAPLANALIIASLVGALWSVVLMMLSRPIGKIYLLGYLALIEIGLLRQKGDVLIPAEAHYKTPADRTSDALKDYYEAALALNRKAVRALPNEMRHLNSISICTDKKNLAELRKAIHQFNKRMINEFDRAEGDIVYQFHTQLVPHAEVEL